MGWDGSNAVYTKPAETQKMGPSAWRQGVPARVPPLPRFADHKNKAHSDDPSSILVSPCAMKIPIASCAVDLTNVKKDGFVQRPNVGSQTRKHQNLSWPVYQRGDLACVLPAVSCVGKCVEQYKRRLLCVQDGDPFASRRESDARPSVAPRMKVRFVVSPNATILNDLVSSTRLRGVEKFV